MTSSAHLWEIARVLRSALRSALLSGIESAHALEIELALESAIALAPVWEIGWVPVLVHS